MKKLQGRLTVYPLPTVLLTVKILVRRRSYLSSMMVV